jgi:hypothetical protein
MRYLFSLLNFKLQKSIISRLFCKISKENLRYLNNVLNTNIYFINKFLRYHTIEGLKIQMLSFFHCTKVQCNLFEQIVLYGLKIEIKKS